MHLTSELHNWSNFWKIVEAEKWNRAAAILD